MIAYLNRQYEWSTWLAIYLPPQPQLSILGSWISLSTANHFRIGPADTDRTLCQQSTESPGPGALGETAKTPPFPIYRSKNAIESPILHFINLFISQSKDLY